MRRAFGKGNREQFVRNTQQALDALPGPENLDVVTIYVVDSPDAESSSKTATVAVEASFTVQCDGWIARQYGEKLLAIAASLLRVVDATPAAEAVVVGDLAGTATGGLT